MARQSGLALRPQDVLVLLKLIASANPSWRQLDLASHLGLSQAEIANSLKRLRHSGLVHPHRNEALPLAALEFLQHALRYILPARIGGLSRGLATGHSAQPLKRSLVVPEGYAFVWQHERGEARGMAVDPIYPSAPEAAFKDPKLHELLAIVDALRLFQGRERKLAEHELRKRLLGRLRKEHENV